jgi:predicted proteasome-type protease
MILDKLNNEIVVGDQIIFSAGKSVEIYEILKIRENTINSAWSEVYVNIGDSKKWKQAIDGIKFNK